MQRKKRTWTQKDQLIRRGPAMNMVQAHRGEKDPPKERTPGQKRNTHRHRKSPLRASQDGQFHERRRRPFRGERSGMIMLVHVLEVSLPGNKHDHADNAYHKQRDYICGSRQREASKKRTVRKGRRK